jgi:PAT family beta-lactamase induction signal transducer AmpG
LDALPALTQSRWRRLALFTACYFAQGVPIGLLTIALPAWLAERGLSLGELATYQAIVALPWGFKLLGGPFMDRFAFLPMGRRRPWAIAMQAGLTAAFLGLTVIEDPLAQLSLVIALAFAVNFFGALQDVAVDGMAIDVLPESDRGRANAFMAFGQVAGFSTFSALSGVLLARYGLAAAALAAALTVSVVLVLVIAFRERPGERFFPWSAGAAAAVTVPRERTFAGIFKGLLSVLFLPMSLVLTLAEWLLRMRDGIAIAALPVLATQTLGFSAEAYSSFQGAMGLLAAAAGLLIGPVIDRTGAKPLYLLGMGGSALVTLLFALSTSLWSSTPFAVGCWIAMTLFGQIIFVSYIACAMSICWGPVAASQFAIYMSLANLARSTGSYLFAPVADELSTTEQLLAMVAFLTLAFVAMLAFRIEPHRARLAELDRRAPA